LRIPQQTLEKQTHGMIIVKCAVVVQKATCCQIKKYRKELKKHRERERDIDPEEERRKNRELSFDELFSELL
jgi:hypothetical protein